MLQDKTHFNLPSYFIRKCRPVVGKWDVSGGIVIKLWARKSSCDSIPGRGKTFFSPSKHSD
jgi:hypothetical protein